MKVYIVASKTLLSVLSIVLSILFGLAMFTGLVALLTFIKEAFNAFTV